MLGNVKWFNNKKGYGFVIGEDGNEYFVHYTSINQGGFKSLKDGQAVSFVPNKSDKGLEAKEVEIL